MSGTTLEVGRVRLTRVSYAEIDIPPDAIGLTAEQVASVPWAEPVWATAGHVRVAAAAWIIESDDARIVVDPALAADDILRNENDAGSHQDAFADLLEGAGFARETITHAVATHAEGIGMFAWRNTDGSWAAFFPNAPLLYSRTELEALDSGNHGDPATVLTELRQAGTVVSTDDKQDSPGVSVQLTGADSPGHQIVCIDSDGERALILGHLALTPLNLAVGVNGLHDDPQEAWTVLRGLRDQEALLIGPLWPAPGAGRWRDATFLPIES